MRESPIVAVVSHEFERLEPGRSPWTGNWIVPTARILVRSQNAVAFSVAPRRSGKSTLLAVAAILQLRTRPVCILCSGFRSVRYLAGLIQAIMEVPTYALPADEDDSTASVVPVSPLVWRQTGADELWTTVPSASGGTHTLHIGAHHRLSWMPPPSAPLSCVPVTLVDEYPLVALDAWAYALSDVEERDAGKIIAIGSPTVASMPAMEQVAHAALDARGVVRYSYRPGGNPHAEN
jgi:hypothetical protein